jgi:hypothetical protein
MKFMIVLAVEQARSVRLVSCTCSIVAVLLQRGSSADLVVREGTNDETSARTCPTKPEKSG